MTGKHIAAVGEEGKKQNNKKVRRRKAGLFSVSSVYFTDYTTSFKQVSRDGESDSTHTLSYQRSVRGTETSALLELEYSLCDSQ